MVKIFCYSRILIVKLKLTKAYSRYIIFLIFKIFKLSLRAYDVRVPVFNKMFVILMFWLKAKKKKIFLM